MLLELYSIGVFFYFLPVLVPKRHWIRFYIVYLNYFINGTLLIISLLPLTFYSLQLYSRVMMPFIRGGFWLIGIDWVIRNRHHLEQPQGCIIVANHQSIFDGAGLAILNNGFHNLDIVAKKELAYFPPTALLFWRMGITCIDRRKTKEAIEAMKNSVSKTQKKKIVIFPEGTRNQKGDGLLPFKAGAFKLAISQQLPIVPVVFSPYTFIKFKKEFSEGKVVVSCLEPISTEGLGEKDVGKLLTETREKMEKEYFRLSGEVQLNNNHKI